MENNSLNTKLIVLVHGAWAAPFAWQTVAQAFVAKGYRVIAPQLPGHGSDNTDAKTLHMDTYINYVIEAIKATGEKVILVGHSMAGMIISGVAEQIPELIEKLVYIAAYVPQNGESAYGISGGDTQSLLGASLIVSEDGSLFDVKLEDATNIFCQDAPDDIKQLVLANYKSEPGAPFAEPVTVSAQNFGRVPKYYVETLQDNGIGNLLQKQMMTAAGITDTYTLNTGHCPMLSQPDALNAILLEIAAK